MAANAASLREFRLVMGNTDFPAAFYVPEASQKPLAFEL